MHLNTKPARETHTGFHPLRRIAAGLVALALVPASALVSPAALGQAMGAPDLSCRTVDRLMQNFLYNHVTTRSVTPELQSSTIEEIYKRFDPSKVLLYEEDVKQMRKDLAGIFRTMELGDCSIISKFNQKIVDRSKELEDFVRTTLSDKNFKLDETVELVLDPEKRGTPKNAADRNAYLTKLLHFQLSNYLASGEKPEEARKHLIHRYELNTKRAKERDERELHSLLVQSFAVALDPHSSYLPPDVLEDFNIGMKLSLEGIGVLLSSQDGYTVVEEIIPGGATDRAKALEPKDKIIAVSQKGEKPVDIMDMDLRDVVRMIRGRKGSAVVLTVLRGGENTQRLNVEIVRDKVDLKEQAAKLTIENVEVDGKKLKVGVIDLPSFYGDQSLKERSSYRDVRKLVEKAQKEKVDGIMLDLSRNGGGLLEEAVKISGLFIEKGGIVAVKNSRQKIDALEDLDEAVVYSGPLVVLTSRLSASASEILAGALKDYKRAVIVGDDHTFGKGTVQAVLNLPPQLGALKVTTSMFFLPGGESTQLQGVSADVVIPSAYSSAEIGEVSFTNALPKQKITSFINEEAGGSVFARSWKPVSQQTIEKLNKLSTARISASKEFQEIREKLRKAEENKGIVRLAEVIKEQKESKAEESKTKGKGKSMAAKEKEEQGPQYKEALKVLGDYIVTGRTVETIPQASAKR